MAFMDTLLRLEHLAHLINRKSTGKREELSRKMNVSVRTVDNLIQLLRYAIDVEVYFCSQRNSYCFRGEVDVRFDYVVQLDSSEEVKGGENNSSLF